MHSNARLDRAGLSAFLSFLLVVCLPYLVLTFVAPGARDVFLCFAFPLWLLGLRPIDRMAGRLLQTLHGAKPRTNARLDRAGLSAFLSFLLVVCLPFLVLTFAAPGARDVFLCFAFPLWLLGLRPIDRMAGRLLQTLHGAKPRKTPCESRDLA